MSKLGLFGCVATLLPGLLQARRSTWNTAAIEGSAAAPRFSATDAGSIARYAGLARVYWHREGGEIAVGYEGVADYAASADGIEEEREEVRGKQRVLA